MASDELIEQLVRLWRVLHRLSAPERQGDLTAQQFWLLRQLRRTGPARVNDLAVALSLAQSSVSVASRRLERAGLVTRERDANDERVVHVALTPLGAERVDAWRERRRRVLIELLTVLDAEEQAHLAGLLERVLERAGDAAQ